jgi:uncharacterized protein YlzI (FlbEa/FlbD family)
MEPIYLTTSHVHEIGITDDNRTNILLKNGDQVVVESSVIEVGKGTTIIRRFE